MKSIQNQYIDLKEGRMSQAQFMRNIRMTLPQYVTNVTSFNDAVKILKNKAILTEAYGAQDIVKKYNEMFGKNPQTTFADVAKVLNVSEDEVQKAMMSVTPSGPGSLKLEEEELKENESDWGYKLGEWFLTEFPEKAASLLPQYSDQSPGEYIQALGNNLIRIFATGVSFAGLGAYATYNTIKDKIKAKFGRSNSNLSEGKKKKLAATEVDQSELRMGIKVEFEHTDDPKKAEKIALDHLAENPFYYTQLKLSGVDVKALPSKEKKAIAKKKDETELKDKANQMKTPKGVEKIKASANKAKKETNKLVKGVKELTHASKKAKGVKQVMSPTGGKMKKIKEGLLNEAGGEYTFNGTLNSEESKELNRILSYTGQYKIETDEVDDHYETTVYHTVYNDKTLEQAVKQAKGQTKSEMPANPFGTSTVSLEEKLKEQIRSIIYEILDETFDGHDDLNAHNDDVDSVTEVKAKNIQIGQEFTLSDDLGNFKMGEKVIVDDVEEDGVDVRIVLVNDAGVKDEFYLDPNDDIELV